MERGTTENGTSQQGRSSFGQLRGCTKARARLCSPALPGDVETPGGPWVLSFPCGQAVSGVGVMPSLSSHPSLWEG